MRNVMAEVRNEMALEDQTEEFNPSKPNRLKYDADGRYCTEKLVGMMILLPDPGRLVSFQAIIRS